MATVSPEYPDREDWDAWLFLTACYSYIKILFFLGSIFRSIAFLETYIS
jgi:hypothetical protein